MIKPIVVFGNSILKNKTEPYHPGTDLTPIIQDLRDTLHNTNGVGLAAPQIGLSTQLFIVEIPSTGFKEVFINPIIVEKFGDDINMIEGCLSIPSVEGLISRKDKITIEYYDEYWMRNRKEFEGIESRVIQHEYDHLYGVLWVDLSDIKLSLKIMSALQKCQKKDIETSYPII